MRFLHRFLRNTQGASVIEFAFVAPVFFFLLLGIIEFGLFRFTQVAIEAAMAQASRGASIGITDAKGDRVEGLRAMVKSKTRGLIGIENIVINAAVVGEGTTVPPDICLTDPPDYTDTCDPKFYSYIDGNGNGRYDPGKGGVSLGKAGDLVEVRVSLPWRMQFPFIQRLIDLDYAENGGIMISSATVIKNEP